MSDQKAISIDLVNTVAFAVQDKSILTVDMEELSRRTAERRKAQDAAEAASKPIEHNWRQELEELTRRLQHFPTVSQAKDFAKSEEKKHAEVIRGIEDELAHVKSLLDLPGLGRCIPLRKGKDPVNGDTCDVCLLNRRIEKLEHELTVTKNRQQVSIRRCGATIATARELDKLRSRWEELKKRANKIDAVRRVAMGKEAVNTDLTLQNINIGDRYGQSQGEMPMDLTGLNLAK